MKIRYSPWYAKQKKVIWARMANKNKMLKMCLYPKLIKNPKYKPNKKNGGIPPWMTDIRTLLVPIGCQKCKECYKQKSNNWRIRLKEEIKVKDNGRAWFITLTLSTESLKELNDYVDQKYKGYEKDNAIATIAVRRWLERWRKNHGKSIRHWLITELGEGTTEHLHIHGIVWTKESIENIRSTWKYGFMHPRPHEIKKNYVNSKSINYMIKYVTKIDRKHIYYRPIILCSSGIGSTYKRPEHDRISDKYRTEQGHKLALPMYYRNKMYTDEEKEKLWIEKLNQKTRWVGGHKVETTDLKSINKILKYKREESEKDGYIGDKIDYDQTDWENKQRDLIRAKRFSNSNPEQILDRSQEN